MDANPLTQMSPSQSPPSSVQPLTHGESRLTAAPAMTKHLWVAVAFAYHQPDLAASMLIVPAWAADSSEATSILDAQNLRIHDPAAGWTGHMVKTEMVSDTVVLQAADAIRNDPLSHMPTVAEGIQAIDVTLPGGDTRAGNFPGVINPAAANHVYTLPENPVLAFAPK